jgi:TatA/E family protein of Tat protein translocase
MGLGLSNPVHIAVLAAELVLVFGAERLPEMGRSIGAGLREFRNSIGSSDERVPSALQTTTSSVSDDQTSRH